MPANHALRHARRRLGISQTELARRADLSRGTVNRIENGAKPTTGKALRALARGLGVSADEIRDDPELEAIRQAISDFAGKRIAGEEFSATVNAELGRLGLPTGVQVIETRGELLEQYPDAVYACSGERVDTSQEHE